MKKALKNIEGKRENPGNGLISNQNNPTTVSKKAVNTIMEYRDNTNNQHFSVFPESF